MERRVASIRQLEILVEQMTIHKDLALGRVRSKEARAKTTRLWLEVADRLNPEGPARSGREWQKYWNDMKCRVRAKLIQNKNAARQTGGGPNTTIELTPLEESIANIIGRDVGPIDGACVEGQVVMEEGLEASEQLQPVAVGSDEIEIEVMDHVGTDHAYLGRRRWSSDSDNSMTAQRSTLAQFNFEDEHPSTSAQENINPQQSTLAQANENSGAATSSQANVDARSSANAARERPYLRGRRRQATLRQGRPQSVAQQQADELSSVQRSLARIEMLRAEAHRAQAVAEQQRAETALVQAEAARTNANTMAIVGKAFATSLEKIADAISNRSLERL